MSLDPATSASVPPGRCVFTTVIGPGGRLTEQPTSRDSAISYICLTDDPDLRSDTWQIRTVAPAFELDPVRSERRLKTRAHRTLPEIGRSLYIESSVLLKVPAEEVFGLVPDDAPVGLVGDSFRQSVLDEFLALAEFGDDEGGRLFEQLNHYQLSAPAILEARLFATGLMMVRDHTDPAVGAMEDLWFEHVLRYSRHDELSVNLALDQVALEPHIIELDTSNSEYHRWPGAHDRGRSVIRRQLVPLTPSGTRLRAAEQALIDQRERADRLQQATEAQTAISRAVLGSRSWRLLAPARRLGRRLRRVTELPAGWQSRLGLVDPTRPMRDKIWYAYFPLVYRIRRRTRGKRWLLVAPLEVRRPYLLWKTAQLMGVDIVRATDRHVPLALRFDAATISTLEPIVADLVINGGCTDVSKRRVELASLAVFGYGIAVDPARHSGPMVEKSDENATHDGVVIVGPILAADPSKVYQRVLDNEVAPGIVEDLRATVVAGKVVGVWQKRRGLHERFANVGQPARALATEAAYTACERTRIVELASHMGLDMCEMDTIRDRTDGRLYVVDVNNTPFSPPGTAHTLAGLRAMHRAAAEFERQWGMLLGRSEA